MTEKQYQKLHRDRRAWYKNVSKVFCPVLKTNVVFNSKGFNHLLYDGTGLARTRKEQCNRLELLPSVIPIIKKSDSIHEYRRKYVKRSGKIIEYWALRANINRQRIEVKVVLRKVGNGNVTFHSVTKRKARKTKKPSV